MTTNTVRLHRLLRAPPARIYRAFLDPEAMVKWLPPHGFTGKVHHLEAKVGGTFRMSFTNFSTGHSHSFGGEYPELVPTNAFAAPTSSTMPTCRDAHHHDVQESVVRDRDGHRSRRNTGSNPGGGLLSGLADRAS